MNFHRIARHIERNVGHMQKIIRKILFDYITLVTTANHKIVNAVEGIDFHDMPENWLTTNLYHWLRSEMGLFRNSRAKTTCENYRFHEEPYLPMLIKKAPQT